MPPTKKARGRPPAANKVTKPAKKPTRRAIEKLAAAAAIATEDALEKPKRGVAKGPTKGRKAKAQDEDGDNDDLAEEDEVPEEEEEEPVPAAKAAPKRRGRKATVAVEETEGVAEVPDSAVKPLTQLAKRGRRPGTKAAKSEELEIPETQATEAMDMDVEDSEPFDDLSLPEQPVHRAPRIGGSSNTDVGEAQLRRRLGEANRKYENMELKYRDLRDLGVKAAERNFDALKKESEERANTAIELIDHLKADLAAQKTLAKEGQQYKKKLEEAEAKTVELTASIADAKQEIKTLSSKLAASRSAEAAAVTAKVPGSAIKGGTAAARAIASSDAVQTHQLKEDLYGDLTGLIVRVIKRDSTGQVFDCIQTGRNGTLHFKLEVEKEDLDDNYEEAQFTYKPQLDSNRDRNLIDMLPDFLTEEIEFSRPHAAKFYSRVTKSLME